MDSVRSQADTGETGLAFRFGQTVALAAASGLALGSLALTLLAIGVGAEAVWDGLSDVANGEASTSSLKVDFIGFASLMLQAVTLFVIAEGLFTLFVSPLPRLGPLSVRSLQDLEQKVLGIIVLIVATSFVEFFITSRDGLETLFMALALGASVAALGGFLLILHWQEERARP